MNFVRNWLRNSPCKFQPDLSSRLGSTLNKPARKRAFSVDPGESPACCIIYPPMQSSSLGPPVPEIGPPYSFFHRLRMRQKLPPPLKN